jgi:hypothetical protein
LFFSFLFSAELISGIAGPEETKNLGEKSPPPDSDPFSDAKFGKNRARLSRQLSASANWRFEFQKRSQLFVRTCNETLSVVVTMCQHCSLNSWIQTALSNSRNAVSISSACTTNRWPSSRCASTIQIVLPSRSTAERQPQLQPALLRLSAMIPNISLHFPLLFDKGLVPFEEPIEQHRLHKIVGYSGGIVRYSGDYQNFEKFLQNLSH